MEVGLEVKVEHYCLMPSGSFKARCKDGLVIRRGGPRCSVDDHDLTHLQPR